MSQVHLVRDAFDRQQDLDGINARLDASLRERAGEKADAEDVRHTAEHRLETTVNHVRVAHPL